MESLIKNVFKRIISPSVRASLRNIETEIKLARTHTKSARDAKTLSGRTGLKLNFGSGPNIKSGWVNIDAFSPSAEYHWDARRPIPLEDGSCSIIYSEHMLEHLDYPGAMVFFQESYRVLNEGGLFRVVLPDFRRIFEEYAAENAEYFSVLDRRVLVNDLEPENVQLIDFVNYSVYQNKEHVCLWDERKLSFELKRTGFSVTKRSSYDEAYDSAEPKRRQFSIYFEAHK